MTDFLDDQYRVVAPMVGSDNTADVPRGVSPQVKLPARDSAPAPDKIIPVFDSRPLNGFDVYFEYMDFINYTVPQGYTLILREVKGNSYSDSGGNVPVVISSGLRLNIFQNGINKILNDPNYGLASVFRAPVFTTLQELSVLTGYVSAASQIVSASLNQWVLGLYTQAQVWGRIAYGAGVYISIDTLALSNVAAYSNDGKNWATIGLPSNQNWVDIKYGNGIFMVISATNVMATSADGINWAQTTMTDPGGQPHWSLIYGTPGGVPTWVKVMSTNVSVSTNNGQSWTDTLAAWPAGDAGFSGAFGNGLFAMGSSNGNILTSTNGSVWTVIPIAGASLINGILYAAGLWVAAGPNSTIWSSDGVNWTRTVQPVNQVAATQLCQSVAYSNGVWKVGAGTLGTSLTSTDGKNWTTETNALTNACVVGVNGLFSSLGAAGTYRNAYYNSRTVQQINAGGLIMKYAIVGQLIPNKSRPDNLAVFG